MRIISMAKKLYYNMKYSKKYVKKTKRNTKRNSNKVVLRKKITHKKKEYQYILTIIIFL